MARAPNGGRGYACDEFPLAVEGLNKRYKRGVHANRGISFEVYPGEVLGILGPNGAGKTTLVRQITTELLPTSGEIRVFGVDAVSDPIGVKNLMGIVPQEAQLFDMLTPRETFRIFGKLRGLSGRDANRRAEELLSELRLEAHGNAINMKLSGGLKRRVMIGIAAVADPDLIVLDEPTTGLDPQSRRDLWNLVREHRARGAAILMTTHYMEEAETLCDRVGIISEGRLLALDGIAGLKSAHGFDFKVTYSSNGQNGVTETIYGKDDHVLVEQVRAMGIRQFSVNRTTLEDVYLELTGDEVSDGDSDRE